MLLNSLAATDLLHYVLYWSTHLCISFCPEMPYIWKRFFFSPSSTTPLKKITSFRRYRTISDFTRDKNSANGLAPFTAAAVTWTCWLCCSCDCSVEPSLTCVTIWIAINCWKETGLDGEESQKHYKDSEEGNVFSERGIKIYIYI